MAAGKRSKSQEAYATRYKSSIFAANRKRKLERVVKEQPNNEKAAMALKDIHYRRKTPNTSAWSASTKREAQLLASFAKHPKPVQFDTISSKNMFSIKARLNGGLCKDATKINGLL